MLCLVYAKPLKLMVPSSGDDLIKYESEITWKKIWDVLGKHFPHQIWKLASEVLNKFFLTCNTKFLHWCAFILWITHAYNKEKNGLNSFFSDKTCSKTNNYLEGCKYVI